MIDWIKGLGLFFGTIVVGVMALSLTLIMPIIALLTTIVCIVAIAGWIAQQYVEHKKQNKAK